MATGPPSPLVDTAPVGRSFDDLVTEAAAAPIVGWDFSWLDGRAFEERPEWGYHRMAGRAAANSRALLDIQTGGGELLREILTGASPRPPVVCATESWSPNVEHARRNLSEFRASVAVAPDDGDLPFDRGAFDLVLSRHPVATRWDEVARVLTPGGRYLAQHVGAGSNRELTDYLMGPQPVSGRRRPEHAVRDARAAGLVVRDLRRARLRVEFFDVGAVVYFLRLVVWTVPDFDVDRYRDRLLALHAEIERDGSFVSHAERFLIQAVLPT